MMNSLPVFDESSPDLPAGYGIEENHDGGWYPYRLVEEESYGQTLRLPHYLKDGQGLDIRCASRPEALAVLQACTLDMSNIEDPVVQARLLAVHERLLQEERQTAAFYDRMAEAQ